MISISQSCEENINFSRTRPRQLSPGKKDLSNISRLLDHLLGLNCYHSRNLSRRWRNLSRLWRRAYGSHIIATSDNIHFHFNRGQCNWKASIERNCCQVNPVDCLSNVVLELNCIFQYLFILVQITYLITHPPPHAGVGAPLCRDESSPPPKKRVRKIYIILNQLINNNVIHLSLIKTNKYIKPSNFIFN